MIPHCIPNLCGNEKKYLENCINTGFVSSVGTYVTEFEEMVARLSGAEGAVACSSGTSAIHASLITLGVSVNDLVIVPSFTFIASANAISYCGATPWFIDISEDSWTISISNLRSELDKNTYRKDGSLYHRLTNQKVAAILPVHVLGIPADIHELEKLSRHYQIPVVADSAAALGASYKGSKIADNNLDISTFSFNGNKTFTCGGGGAIVSKDKDLLKKLKHITTTAKVGEDYTFDQVGYNYRLTNLQAAVGLAQLENFNSFLSKKKMIRNLD